MNIKSLYHGHRFPPEIISHAVWLYHRFCLSFDEGGMSFPHNARQVFLDDLHFDVEDRFTYTCNFYEFWLCDIRVEAIDLLSKPAPRCFGGSGRKGDRSYYKVDELIAGMKVIEKVATAGNSATVGDIRDLLECYEAVRFCRPATNKQLKEFLPALS